MECHLLLMVCSLNWLAHQMKQIITRMNALRVGPTKTAQTYKEEARRVIRKCNLTDRNFKYMFSEFIELTKEYVEIEMIRDVISRLQKYTTHRLAQADKQDSYMPIRDKSRKNKIRQNKRK